MAKAYNGKNNNYVWNDASNWNNFFGEHGDLKRVISELVIIDGLDLKVSSDVVMTESEINYLSQSGHLSVFPLFFGGGDKSRSENKFSQDSGSFSIHTKTNIGSPTILGVNVMSIETMFS